MHTVTLRCFAVAEESGWRVGKFALGVEKRGEKSFWSSPLQDENCNDSKYSALNYCLFTLPSSQPITSPTSHHPHQSSIPFFTFSPLTFLSYCYTHLPDRTWNSYKRDKTKKKALKVESLPKTQKEGSESGWRCRWQNMEGAQLPGFLFDVSPLTIHCLICNSSPQQSVLGELNN